MRSSMVLKSSEHRAMSKESRRRRRELVQRLREEGAAAFAAGKHRQTCPHRYMNQYQWLQGYSNAEDEAARLKQQEQQDQ